jgi:hypothetical protein
MARFSQGRTGAAEKPHSIILELQLRGEKVLSTTGSPVGIEDRQ